ncbi:MAG: uroporphyrinogen-III synthase, partial [Planctomycetota bacterium]
MARIWVGRPEAEAEAWCEELRAAGHEAAALPLIAVRRLAPGPEDRAVLADLASFDWAFFTSRHAVAALFDLLPEGAWPERLRAAAVGAATAAALRGRGVEPALCG